MVTPGNNVTAADMAALATLANSKLLPLVNAAISSDQNFWRTASNIFYDIYGNIEGLGNRKNIYDISASTASGTPQPVANPQPSYAFSISVENWHDELNRIRGDMIEMVLNFDYTGANNLFLSRNALVSGPWCVGVNDPVTWPIASQGILGGSVPLAASTTPTMCVFKNVAFAFFEEDAPGGFNVTGAMNIPLQHYMAGVSTGFPFTLNYAINADGAISVTISWTVNGPAGAPPSAGSFTTSATPSTSVTWSTSTVSSGVFHLTATFAYTAAYGDSGSIAFAVSNPPSGYTFAVTTHIDGPSTYDVVWQGSLQFASSSTQTPITAISPVKTPVQIALSESSATHETLVLNTIYAITTWTLSDTAVPGVWIANTLPVPGNNVYIDQDMPPYINSEQNAHSNTTINVGVSSAQIAALSGPTPNASSMRCQVTSGAADFNQALSARPASPTPYLVLRDTDFTPFNLGFNPNESLNINSGTAGASGSSLVYGNPSGIPSSANSLKLRLVQGGTGGKGWRAGTLGYGTALTGTMRVFFALTGVPDPSDPSSYDFYVDSNSIDFPGAAPAGYPGGSAAYWAAIIANTSITYAIQNNTSATAPIDVIEQVDFGGVAPVRIYFPPIYECFSYSMDGTPRICRPLVSYNYNKHIPQAGYSIFKIRATRLPIDNGTGIRITPTTGAAITATLGQNIPSGSSVVFTPFMVSGSPVTITIPLNTRDSGDVEVLWPVLAGTELIYQCETQIIVEAWVNFQPVWFNALFGIESGVKPAPPILQVGTTAFKYCLGFANWFDPTAAGYAEQYLPGGVAKGYPVAQFPISGDIYNDLYALLGVI